MYTITAMRKLTDTQVAEVGRLYGAGASGRELGKQYGVTQTTIYAALDRIGIARRPSRSELHKVTLQQIDDAIRRYQNGEMLRAIAAEYGVTYDNLSRHLKNRSVARYPNGYQSRAFSPSEDEEIGRRYEAGENIYELAKSYSSRPMTVRKAILRSGHMMRHPKVAHRRYSLDELAFDSLTPGTAYWVGFLMADGCLMSQEHESQTVSVSVKLDDKEHLVKLTEFLAYDGRILGPYQRKEVSLAIRNDHLANGLRHWGMAERKSLNENPHQDLLTRVEFWRGLIDGDGSVSSAKSNDTRALEPVLSLVGGKRTVTAFVEWAKGFTQTPAIPHCDAHGLWRFAIKCAPAVDVIRKLYADCDPALALDRKLARANAILARWPNGYDGPATEPLW